MADEEVPLRFTVRDAASQAIDKIRGATEKLVAVSDRAVARFSELGGMLAGAAGAFSLERAAASGRDYLDSIRKISNLTGLSANKTAGMQHALEQADISSDSILSIFTSLGKKSATLAEGNGELAKMAKQWGVDMKHGPEESLVSMSRLVKEHKIGQGQVAQLVRASGENASNLMELLRRGPDELQKSIQKGQQLNSFVNDQTMEGFTRFHEASLRFHQTWRRITGAVFVGLGPGLDKILTRLESSMSRLQDSALKFGENLGKKLDWVLQNIHAIGKAMAYNLVLSRATGMGLVGNAARIASSLGGNVRGMFGGGLPSFALKGGATGVMNSPLSAFFGASVGMGGVVKNMLALAGKATLFLAAAQAISSIVGNIDGARTRIVAVLTSVWNELKKAGDAIENAIGHSLGDVLISLIEVVGKLVAKIVGMVATFINAVSRKGLLEFLKNPADMWAAAQSDMEVAEETKYAHRMRSIKDLTDRLAGAKGPVTDEQRRQYQSAMEMWKGLQGDMDNAGVDYTGAQWHASASVGKLMGMKGRFGGAIKKAQDDGVPDTQVYQDFRGSRFDITQAFSEGFDPDRVAVAFANELGSLGEKRLQSGFSPLFAIR
jgi:hypothetical protein